MFAGITRSGKTTAARQVVRKYLDSYAGLRVHIFDPKDVGDYDRIAPHVPVRHVRGSVAPDLLREPGVLIWHPQGATFEDYETFFQRIADDPAPNLTVVDETRRLSKRLGDGTSFPLSLATLLQEGGGKLHAVIMMLQEIAGSARQIMGQATHLFRFRMMNDYDERMTERPFARARRSGRIKNKEPQHWHGFFHSRIDMLDQANEYASWRNFI